MRWPAVLAAFHALELTATTDSGRLVVEGPVPQLHPRLVEAIREHRDTLVAILAGGHTWAPCDNCGHGLLLAVRTHDGKTRTDWPACRLTPRCRGAHTPRPSQVAALVAAGVPAPPPQARPPARPAHRRLLGGWPEYPSIRPRRAV